MMLALAWFSYFMYGLMLYSVSPLVTPILAELDISYSQMGIIMGAWPLPYILVAILGGALVDRLGIRWSIFFGLAIIALSAGLRFFASGFTALFLCVALFGLGAPMISIGNPKTIALWFRGKERSMAVGIYMTGAWVGAAICISMMNSVIMPLAGNSWRTAYLGFGILGLILAILWWLLARDVKTTTADEGNERFDRVFRGIISSRSVQFVLVMGLLSFFSVHGFANWLPNILESGGLSPSIAGLAASLPTWVGVPTIIIVPRFVPQHFRTRFIAIISGLVAVAQLGVVQLSGGPMIAGLVLYGMANACILPFLVLILMELPDIDPRYLGSVTGVFFCISELGAFCGPFLMGAIKDMAGGFFAGVALLAGLSVIRLVIALRVRTGSAAGTA